MKKKPNPAKPARDRTDEFIEHLKEYSDWEKYDFRRFPKGLPRYFPLKLGSKTVGRVVVDWEQAFIKLFTTTFKFAKPKEITEEEHQRRIEEMLALATPSVKDAALTSTLPFTASACCPVGG